MAARVPGWRIRGARTAGLSAGAFSLRSLWLLPRDRLFALCVLVVAIWRVFQPLNDPDLWWHLRTGELVLSWGRVPTTDPFSFTARGHPWVAQEWLGEVLMWLLWGLAGPVAIQLLAGGLMLAALGLVYLRLRRSGSGVTASALTAAGALLVAGPAMRASPTLFGAAFASLCLLCLEEWRRSGRATWLMVLPPLALLWANLHASFINGWLVVAGYLLGLYLQKGPRAGGQLAALALAGAGMAVATAANPHGPGLALFALAAASMPFNRQYVAEWQAPSLAEPAFLPFWIALLPLGAAVLLWIFLGGDRRDWPGLVLALGCTAETLASIQGLWLFALTAPPFIARTFGSASSLPAAPRPGRRLAAAHWLGLAGVLALFLPRVGSSLGDTAFRRAELTEYPVEAVRTIVADDLTGPLFNSYNWGGYVIWRAWPRVPVFVDGRTELYGNDFLQRYRRVYLGLEDWQPLFNEYQVRLALLERGNPLALALQADPRWSTVHADSLAVVLMRILY